MVATVATDVLAQIAARYRFRGEGVPEAVTEAGTQVAALLLEAGDQIVAYFGPEPTLVLEFFISLDEDDEPGKLYGLIQTKLDPDQAVPIMDRWLRQWWVKELQRGEGRLNFDIEYV